MKTDPKLPDSIDPSPEKLLAPFAKGRIVQWMVVAVILHAILIGGTSLDFIRDVWINHMSLEEHKAKVQAALDAAKPPPKVVKTPAKPAVPAPAPNAAAPVVAPTVAATAAPAAPSDRSNTPIVKKITATATTNEIPKNPDDLDININDTDRK
jgi:hypothetical protein